MTRITLFTALLFSLLPAAMATTFYEQPFPEAVEDAPVIVRGRVGMSYTNWDLAPDGARRIYTFTELSIDEVFKGNPGAAGPGRSVVMRELGGEKDGMGMQVSGTASFKRGEDTVVFLSPPNADGSLDVRGMMMGKYNVQRGEDGKEYLVGAGLKSGSHHSLQHDHYEKDAVRPDTAEDARWTLDALRRLARKAHPSSRSEEKYRESQELEKGQPSPIAAPMPHPKASSLAAPQLQPSHREAPSAPWGKILLVLTGGIGSVGLGILILKRRRS